MRILITCIALALSSPFTPAEEKKEPGPAAKEAEKVYRRYVEAGVQKDDKALSAVLLDDFTLTLDKGSVLKRAEAIGLLLAPDLKQEPTSIDELTVRVYGDSAIINCRSTEKGKQRGVAFENTMQSTVTLIKKDGKWSIAAEHVSPVRK
jgi:ketosteroid isomerase-like protein